MTVERLRRICLALPGATEDVKWDDNLVFSVGGRMFALVNIDPPHALAFKCTPEMFAALIERPGIVPAPYLARAMWVAEEILGGTLETRELNDLLRASYDLVAAKLSTKARTALTKAPPPDQRRPTRPPRKRATL
jgi:predicted DNA-binding protein (MmcQ/YjbR family)